MNDNIFTSLDAAIGATHGVLDSDDNYIIRTEVSSDGFPAGTPTSLVALEESLGIGFDDAEGMISLKDVYKAVTERSPDLHRGMSFAQELNIAGMKAWIEGSGFSAGGTNFIQFTLQPRTIDYSNGVYWLHVSRMIGLYVAVTWGATTGDTVETWLVSPEYD